MSSTSSNGSANGSTTKKVAREVMNYAGLDLGYPTASKRVVHVLDLEVNVYGLDEIAGSTRDIAVACLSHGWANKASHLEGMATGLVGEAHRLSASGRRHQTKDLICVILDHRNHGARYKGQDNLSFGGNRKTMLQMMATLRGGQADYRLLMDMLGSYLFPHDERRLTEWMFLGVSLGGHLTWRMLREDPRVTIGVPIVSVPPETLGWFITHRSEVPRPDDPDFDVAQNVYEFFTEETKPEQLRGKHILSMHGAIDPLMNISRMGSTLRRIVPYAQDWEIFVQEGTGHQVTPEMTRKAAEWFYRFGMTDDGAKL